MNIMFHQLNLSPHIVPLAEQLAKMGHNVVFVTYGHLSDERRKLGWNDGDIFNCKLYRFSTKNELIRFLEENAQSFEHICQGLRANGQIQMVQKFLSKRGIKYFVTSESIDCRTRRSLIKRLIYKYHALRVRENCKGVLAIGKDAPDFFESIGFSRHTIFDFAYFVHSCSVNFMSEVPNIGRFRFLYVGQLIDRKRVDLCLEALAQLDTPAQLDIIGMGERRTELEGLVKELRLSHVNFHGSIPMDAVRDFMAIVDCLILPSRFDGWGAVVSESIVSGTPVICSDACGVSGVIDSFERCYVFRNEDLNDLVNKVRLISQQSTSQDDRIRLARSGESLASSSGAKYLTEIIEHTNGVLERPMPPWRYNLEGMA